MEMRRFGDLTAPFIAGTRWDCEQSNYASAWLKLTVMTLPILPIRFRSVFRAAFFVPTDQPCKMNPAGREWFDIDDRVNGPIIAAPFIDNASQMH